MTCLLDLWRAPDALRAGSAPIFVFLVCQASAGVAAQRVARTRVPRRVKDVFGVLIDVLAHLCQVDHILRLHHAVWRAVSRTARRADSTRLTWSSARDDGESPGASSWMRGSPRAARGLTRRSNARLTRVVDRLRK